MNNQQGGDPRFIWNKGWLFLLDVKQCEWACMSVSDKQTDQSRSHRYAHHTARPRWAWPLTLGCRIVGQMHAWLAEGGKAGESSRGRKLMHTATFQRSKVTTESMFTEWGMTTPPLGPDWSAQRDRGEVSDDNKSRSRGLG